MPAYVVAPLNMSGCSHSFPSVDVDVLSTFPVCGCITLLRLLLTKYDKPGDLNNRNLLFQVSGGQQF